MFFYRLAISKLATGSSQREFYSRSPHSTASMVTSNCLLEKIKEIMRNIKEEGCTVHKAKEAAKALISIIKVRQRESSQPSNGQDFVLGLAKA